MPASLRQRSRRPSAAPWRSQTKTTARGSASTTFSIPSPPRLDAPGACSARRGRAQLDDCLARAAVLTRERAAPGLRRGGRRAGVRRHHRAGDRRDRQCGQHDAAGRRRGRRRDPPRRRTHDPSRVPPARRLRHRRRQVDARRAAAGPLRHPRRRPGLPRRQARGAGAARERLPPEPRGRGRARPPVGCVPVHLDRRLSLPDRRGGPHRPRHGGPLPGGTAGDAHAGALRPFRRRGPGRLRDGARAAARLNRRLATPGAAWHRGEGRTRVSAAERERTTMRRVLVALVLLGVVLGRPAVLRAERAAAELGLAVGAAAGNLVYLPVKLIVAFGGLALGSLTGVLTGGDERAAYAVWVPAASGTYLLTPAHLEGPVPIEFFGSDYADQSSKTAGAAEGAGIYDIQYQSR